MRKTGRKPEEVYLTIVGIDAIIRGDRSDGNFSKFMELIEAR